MEGSSVRRFIEDPPEWFIAVFCAIAFFGSIAFLFWAIGESSGH